MANPWFRLWGDMVNDPKFRTIARVSKQEVSRVLSVYLHMMTQASNATERGRTQGWNDEDVATALDIETEDVAAIREAMQGRVLDGDYLTGWEKRQPVREDGASERGKAFRERKNAEKEAEKTKANACERKRTPEEIREEESREDKKQNTLPSADSVSEFESAWSAYPARSGASKKDSLKAWSARVKEGASPAEILVGVQRYAAYVKAMKVEDKFIKQPATFFGPGDHFKSTYLIGPDARGAPNGQKQSRHNDFDTMNYSEGIEDGRLI